MENTFRDNSARCFGGALYILKSGSTLIENTFHNNLASLSGGALHVLDSTLTLTGNAFKNNSAFAGGALLITDGRNLTLTGNTFQFNSASYGGVLYVNVSTLTLIENTFQNNSASYDGGVLYVGMSTLTLTENTFQYNSASDSGGVLLAYDSNIVLAENTFQYNYAIFSGVLSAAGSVLTLTDNVFQNNSAFVLGGALYVSENSTLSLSRNIFQNNSADSGPGGALYVLNSILDLTKNAFQNTSATLGGALYIHASTATITDNHFTDSSAQLGGTILTAENSNVGLYGRNTIEHSTAEYGGGIAALDCQLQLAGNTIFENNTASYGGGLYTHNSNITVSAAFINNLATEGGGGAYVSSSALYFIGNTHIVNNSAVDGGGLLLSGDSKLYLQPDIAVHLISNCARSAGGAIKVEESNPLSTCIRSINGNFGGSSSDCFFQIELKIQSSHSEEALINSIVSTLYNSDTIDIPYSSLTNVSLHFFDSLGITLYFDNNTAAAGADLYGGSVDRCSLSIIERSIKAIVGLNTFNPEITRLSDIYHIYTSGYVFDIITSNDAPVYYPNGEVAYFSDYITISNKSLDLSSSPLYICTCRDNHIHCTGSYHHPEPVYPGGTLEVPVIAQGQRNGTTPAIIQVINTPESSITLPQNENTQNVNNSCTTLKYTIQSFAENTTQNMTLYAVGPCTPTQNNTLTVAVNLLPCPFGFQLSENEPICICAKRLQRFTNTCLIDNIIVLRAQDAEFWVVSLEV